MVYSSGHFYLKELAPEEQEFEEYNVKTNNNIFRFFNILDQDFKVIDTYDYINLKNVRIDLINTKEGFLFRIYPAFLGQEVEYNADDHSITTKGK
jgi:hypothetical protein